MAAGQASTQVAATAPERLPDTTYAILGVLTFGEMSGYDLGKVLQRTVAQFFFNPAKSQIYAELKRLVASGYATEQAVAQQSRPDKRLYAITTRGRKALRAWLETSEVGPDAIRSPLFLHVFFGGLMDRETLVEQVRQGRQRAQENLGRLRGLEREIKGKPEYFFPGLVLRRGLAHERAAIRWANGVLRDLAQSETGANVTPGQTEAQREAQREAQPKARTKARTKAPDQVPATLPPMGQQKRGN